MIFETAATISGVSPGASLSQTLLVGTLGEQPVAEVSDRQTADRREGIGVVLVDDQPGDLVIFIRNDRLVEKRLQRQLGQRHLRRDPFLGVLGGDPGQDIAGAQRRRLRHQIAQIGEAVSCGWKVRSCTRSLRELQSIGIALPAIVGQMADSD